MPPSNERENDPVDALLRDGNFDRDDQLRDAVLAQTTTVLRRRRYLRRSGIVAALAICYLAGAATMQWWRTPASDDGDLIVRQTEERPSEIAIQPDRGTMRPTAETPDRQRQTHELCRAGFDDIRRVSDRYLHEQGDVALALRYYTRALETASNEQRTISVEEDSWLLMALKKSQMEEKQDGNNG